MKRFLRCATLVLAILALLVVAAPFVPWSTRILLAALERFSPLEIDYAGGSLAGALHLNRVKLATGDIVLDLEDVHTELAPSCFWRSSLCFSQFNAASFSLEIPPSPDTGGAPDAAPATKSPTLRIPVRIEADTLSVGALRVAWPDGEWRQGPMVATVAMGGRDIEVVDATVSDGYLELRDSGRAQPETPVIELPEIVLPLNLSVGNLRLQRLSYNIYGQEQALESLELEGGWRRTRLHLARASIAAPPWGSVALEGKLRFRDNWPLELDAAVRLDEPPSLDRLHGRELTLRATGDLADLAVVTQSPGAQSLRLSAQLDVLDRALPFRVALDATWPESLSLSSLVDVPPALADVVLQSPLAASAGGTLAQQTFELRAAASGLGYEDLVVELAGTQHEGRLLVEQLVLRDASGRNELVGEGSLGLGAPYRGTMALQSSGLDLPAMTGSVVGRVSGRITLDGLLDGAAWQGAITGADLIGEVNGLPARLSGFAGIASDLSFAPSDLEAEVNGARLLLKSAEGDPSARIDFSLDDLGRWLPGSRGQVELAASLAALDGDVTLSGRLSALAWGGAEVASGSISGQYRPRDNDAFELDLALEEVALEGIDLSSVRLRGEGAAPRQSLALTLAGDVEGRIELSGGPLGPDWRGTVMPTAVSIAGGAWRLDDPVAIAWSGEPAILNVAGHCWLHEQTRICPGDLLLGERGRASLEIDGDLSFLAMLFPEQLEVEGELELRVDAAWEPGLTPDLNGYVGSRNLRLTRYFAADERATVSWDSAQARLEQGDGGLHLEGWVQREGRRVIDLELLLPPDGKSRELSGSLNFEGLRLATLKPLAPQLAELQGELTGEIGLSGTPDQPLGTGAVHLSNGRVAVVGNPTALESLALTLQLHGERGSLAGTGLLGGGEVKLDGNLWLRPALKMEMRVQGEQHRLLFPPSTALVVSESLLLKAQDNLLDISGDITVLEGNLEYERLPEGSVAVSGDVVVVDYAGNIIRQEQPFDTRLQIRLKMQDRFEIVVGGLRATVGGDLQVQQSPGQPVQLFGNLNIIGGELTAYRQRLVIKRGTVAFTGRPENPELNVRAERDIRADNVTVGVELLGTLEDPDMRIYSDPAMSQSEAMSYLIRGRGLDTGAALDGTALAFSMGADLVNSSGVLSGFERLPGISQVRLGAEGSADETSATVSGYLGERLYLAYGIGLYEPITVLTARLYISARLWLEVVSRLENSVDLYYSFDIR